MSHAFAGMAIPVSEGFAGGDCFVAYGSSQ
jgi:hypothetical protein